MSDVFMSVFSGLCFSGKGIIKCEKCSTSFNSHYLFDCVISLTLTFMICGGLISPKQTTINFKISSFSSRKLRRKGKKSLQKSSPKDMI